MIKQFDIHNGKLDTVFNLEYGFCDTYLFFAIRSKDSLYIHLLQYLFYELQFPKYVQMDLLFDRIYRPKYIA